LKVCGQNKQMNKRDDNASNTQAHCNRRKCKCNASTENSARGQQIVTIRI
jgi:hypothetical protein